MTLIATCHCGATKIELPHPPVRAGECNCTFCGRTGAVWGYYQPGEMQFTALDGDKVYSATGMNLHHFCSNCGMQTWGDSPNWASMYNADGTSKNGDPNAFPTERSYAVNLRMVDDLDWSTITIEKMDGRHNW
jgi:hypothetical protein